MDQVEVFAKWWKTEKRAIHDVVNMSYMLQVDIPPDVEPQSTSVVDIPDEVAVSKSKGPHDGAITVSQQPTANVVVDERVEDIEYMPPPTSDW